MYFQAGGVKPLSSTAISLSPPILKPPVSSTAISPSPPILKPPMSSTYEEIMDTLRLLEEVPPALEPSASPTTATAAGKGGWEGDGAASTTGDRGRGSWGGGGAAGRLSNGKLESILSYLDQVERVEVNRSNQLAQPLPASSLLRPHSAAATAQQVKYVSTQHNTQTARMS